ncbi:MAG: GNAT family N-acetyltransferase [Nitrosomonadales bacterium]|nr:GNAT family N-acetyltransferase [Nitrosomonadales bacterium]
MNKLIRQVAWDTVALGMPAWELLEHSAVALQQAVMTAGHHTIKVDPLADKRLLHEHGFYYCDTLIEPHCNAARLRPVRHPDATISKEVDAQQVLAIGHGAFVHGRFHRDFNLGRNVADLRYDNWLRQLLDEEQVYGLYWQGALSGFIGHSGNSLVLHALAEQQRGKGRAKFWWSAACSELLAAGHEEIRSSISASNLGALNLYASLGFSFKHPQDVYHRLTVTAQAAQDNESSAP